MFILVAVSGKGGCEKGGTAVKILSFAVDIAIKVREVEGRSPRPELLTRTCIFFTHPIIVLHSASMSSILSKYKVSLISKWY